MPPDVIGREREWARLRDFVESRVRTATLGIVWGRRRVGKSTLLAALCGATGGFYYPALRGSKAEALRDLGVRLGERLGAPAPLDLPDWQTAAAALLGLAPENGLPVVLDEYPYLREHSPELDAILQRAFGPGAAAGSHGPARLILCGSAISIMQNLLAGTAPLRGRASLDLRVSAFGFRAAKALHGVGADLRLAVDLYAVIGGVAAYARDMVDDDLPTSRKAFDHWVARRVVSPSSPLFREVDLLLSEDPSTSAARKLNLYHATLAGVATGNHAFGRLTKHLRMSGPSLAPVLNALVDAELVHRLQDPLRDNRPTYQPGDSMLRFHYAVIRPHQARLERAADSLAIWRDLRPTFSSQVLGPTFEAIARDWVRDHASATTLGGVGGHVGSSSVDVDGTVRQLDVVATAARETGDHTPSGRRVLAIGEAKVGEPLTRRHLHDLEAARAALGQRAMDAKLLLIGSAFAADLRSSVKGRGDVELVDLQRLYSGD